MRKSLTLHQHFKRSRKQIFCTWRVEVSLPIVLSFRSRKTFVIGLSQKRHILAIVIFCKFKGNFQRAWQISFFVVYCPMSMLPSSLPLYWLHSTYCMLANTDWTIHGSFPPIPIVLPFKLKGGEGKHFSELDLPYASIHIPYPYMTTCNKGLIIFYIRCLIFQRIYCTQSKNFTSYNAIFQVVSIWMRSAILQLKFMKCTTYFFHFWRWIAI